MIVLDVTVRIEEVVPTEDGNLVVHFVRSLCEQAQVIRLSEEPTDLLCADGRRSRQVQRPTHELPEASDPVERVLPRRARRRRDEPLASVPVDTERGS